MPLRPFSRDQVWLLPPSLNDFLPSGRRRFEFAPGKDADHRQRREFQLGQARRMLDRAALAPAPLGTPL